MYKFDENYSRGEVENATPKEETNILLKAAGCLFIFFILVTLLTYPFKRSIERENALPNLPEKPDTNLIKKA